VLTFDKDFGDLVFRDFRSASAGVILFRYRNRSSLRQDSLIVDALESRADWAGYFSVIDERGTRSEPISATQP
jgi:hypothetical protein